MNGEHQHRIEPWVVEQIDELKDCRIFKLNREIVRSPATGKRGEFFVLDAPDWVNVIPVTPDDQIVFVSQYRLGSHRVSLETPAGLAEPGEEITAAAARELREETGYSARAFTMLGRTYANPAFMTNHFTALIGEAATLTDPTKWDEHEELEIHLVPVDQVGRLISSGAVENSFTALALSWYVLYRHGLIQPGQ